MTIYGLGFTFRVVDVGGQKSERRKWIHCFQDVTAVLFVVSLADYDLPTDEDYNVNRLSDSLDLFNKVVNNNWFKSTNIILFLNKKDVFERKIKHIPITEWVRDWPNADTANDYDSVVSYITDKFMENNQGVNRSVFKHITMATDTTNVQQVWAAVHQVLVKESVSEAGFGL